MFFTTDERVVQIVYDSLTVLYVYIFFDCIRGIGSGTIRGLGWQVRGAVITFVCYWILGLAGAVYLGFNKNQGVPGMWLAFTYCCMLYVIIQYGVIEACTTWPDFRKTKEPAPPMTPEDRAFRKVVKENEIRKGNTPA